MKPSYVQLICQQKKKMLSLVSESLFSLVSSSSFFRLPVDTNVIEMAENQITLLFKFRVKFLSHSLH